MRKEKFSFSKENKLLTSYNYDSVFNNKINTLSSKEYILLVSNGENKNIRIGIIVSKKVSKKAVVRNLLKRKVREAFRIKLPILQKAADINNKNVDLVFIVKKDAFSKKDFNHEKICSIFDKLHEFICC
jgi:ribonuclease P protein component